VPVEYRPMHSGEEAAVLSLWKEVWKDGSAYFERYFTADPHRRPEHTCVAVDDKGRFLSAAHVCLRDLRDADGIPRRVGCIANVATRKRARNQGHSGQLLELTIEVMEAEGCTGSLLYTGTNRHYERYGWRTLPTPFRQGPINPQREEGPVSSSIHPYSPVQEPDGWERLAAVYAAFNAGRPLTVVRSLAYWQGFGARAFTEPGALVLAATANAKDTDLAGYLLVHRSDQEISLLEIGWRPGADDSVSALLSAAANLAAGRQAMKMTVRLPFLPEIDAALDRVAPGMTVTHHHGAMVRAIGAGLDQCPLDAAFAAPGAIFWDAGGF
jgi:GNAT superfamily N-acetyltransferase